MADPEGFRGGGGEVPGRFSPESFRPGSFRHGFRPWIISAKFGGSFRPDFFLSPPG